MAIRVKIQGKRIILLAEVCIFLHEARRDRIVHARVEVVKAGLFVILITREKNAVVNISCRLQNVAEGVVVVCGGDLAGWGQNDEESIEYLSDTD